MSSLRHRLFEILKEVLDVPLTASGSLDRASLAEWDSLNHLRIIIRIEEEFNIRLDFDNVVSIASLDELTQVVVNKTQDNLSPVRASAVAEPKFDSPNFYR